jgi:hypothetical protein
VFSLVYTGRDVNGTKIGVSYPCFTFPTPSKVYKALLSKPSSPPQADLDFRLPVKHASIFLSPPYPLVVLYQINRVIADQDLGASLQQIEEGVKAGEVVSLAPDE